MLQANMNAKPRIPRRHPSGCTHDTQAGVPMTPKRVSLWHEAEVREKRRDSLRRQDGGVPIQWRRPMRSRRSATLPL